MILFDIDDYITFLKVSLSEAKTEYNKAREDGCNLLMRYYQGKQDGLLHVLVELTERAKSLS
jgi:hypothetical protein